MHFCHHQFINHDHYICHQTKVRLEFTGLLWIRELYYWQKLQIGGRRGSLKAYQTSGFVFDIVQTILKSFSCSFNFREKVSYLTYVVQSLNFGFGFFFTLDSQKHKWYLRLELGFHLTSYIIFMKNHIDITEFKQRGFGTLINLR